MKSKLKFGLVGALSAMAAASVQAEEYTAAHYLPPTHPLAIAAYDQYAELVADMTNGEVTFEVFGGGALFPPTSALTAIAEGLAQVGFVVANYSPSELPVTASLGDRGFSHPDPMVLAAAMIDFQMNDAQGYQEWRDGGVVVTTGLSTPEYYFICNKPMRELSDFQGAKVRTPTSGFGRLVESFGGVPVSIPSNEIYTAFDRGSLDCTTGDVTFLLGSVQILEVVNSITMLPMTPSYTSTMHAHDEEFWQGLSDQNRRALLDAAARTMARQFILYDAERVKGMEAAEANLEIIEPTQEMQDALAAFIEANTAEEIAAAKQLGVQNPEDLLNRFEEYLVRWEGHFEGVDLSDEDAITAVLMDNLYSKIDETTYGMD